MLFTKELAAKGTAMLGSAGAGGTGLYYGGNYLANMPGAQLEKKVLEKEGNHISWEIKKPGTSGADANLDPDINPLKFNNQDSFVVKVVSKSVDNTEQANYQQSQNTASNINLSCNFKFEVEGTRGSAQAIKEQHKKKIFWQSKPNNQNLGLFGVLQQKLNHYTNDTTSADKDKKWTAEEIKEVKNKFFENCKAYNSPNAKTEPIVIKFKVEGNELVPSEITKADFEKWFFFTDDQANKEYPLPGSMR